MVEQKEIDKKEFKELRNSRNVISVEHDDQPDNVADKFMHMLDQMGIKVEVLYPPVDVPTILYHIHPPETGAKS